MCRESEKLGECSDRESLPDTQKAPAVPQSWEASGRDWNPASIRQRDPQETAQEFNWDSEKLRPKRKGGLEIDPLLRKMKEAQNSENSNPDWIKTIYPWTNCL